eukprot:1548648-Pyramimonas_sp.AAC.1
MARTNSLARVFHSAVETVVPLVSVRRACPRALIMTPSHSVMFPALLCTNPCSLRFLCGALLIAPRTVRPRAVRISPR